MIVTKKKYEKMGREEGEGEGEGGKVGLNKRNSRKRKGPENGR